MLPETFTKIPIKYIASVKKVSTYLKLVAVVKWSA
ncbi:hypothetical protein Igag_1480 [Ignisphaera aggregans DSM 17230]|uniref:Uncharacterized protein n=1 Tax=Ignisphaera aggregans (strain DSM 17230 / JCM 13409 / AQ1.S1) TaxID=583356 RepID=E0SQV2_IGNAA|nr:hypothetical protein Igag_1480 [Ignisphaera aggregans DSM 17230]